MDSYFCTQYNSFNSPWQLPDILFDARNELIWSNNQRKLQIAIQFQLDNLNNKLQEKNESERAECLEYTPQSQYEKCNQKKQRKNKNKSANGSKGYSKR